MLGRIFTVGGFTLLSRITGFARDIVLAAVLGAGPIADAFFVALRLPNHFRAIFAEGAFNAAFVPSYARIREQRGLDTSGLFADRVFTLMMLTQVVLLALALAFTPWVIRLLAPGFADDPGRFALAVDLTRVAVLEVLLLAADVTRQAVRPTFRWPRLDEELTLFLKRFGPATLGSAGTQVALFADTIIASFLATGALSALYYADRLNQLPIGVI